MMIQSELIARQDDYMMERAKLAPAVAVAEDRMGQLNQANYPGALQTPLGDNFLVLTSFSGNGVLGQPFVRHEYPCWSACVP
jgi:hypothetical protein